MHKENNNILDYLLSIVMHQMARWGCFYCFYDYVSMINIPIKNYVTIITEFRGIVHYRFLKHAAATE